MELERYEYFWDDGGYSFYSEGPRGRILKRVKFMKMRNQGVVLYNLVFGDAISGGERIDDLAVSDNGDMMKILCTVAVVVEDFSNDRPGVLIFAEGSTPARTRLYQMGINKFCGLIQLNFEIFGYRDLGWVKYSKGERYEAFMVRRVDGGNSI